MGLYSSYRGDIHQIFEFRTSNNPPITVFRPESAASRLDSNQTFDRLWVADETSSESITECMVMRSSIGQSAG